MVFTDIFRDNEQIFVWEEKRHLTSVKKLL